MIGPLVLIIGLLGVWAFFKGKSKEVLDAITNTGFSTSLDNALGNLNLSPSGTASSSAGSVGSSTSGGTSLFNVPIIGPDGTTGTIQVVAHDAASAAINATQGGNSPTGPATGV